jgi:hypothetical protein
MKDGAARWLWNKPKVKRTLKENAAATAAFSFSVLYRYIWECSLNTMKKKMLTGCTLPAVTGTSAQKVVYVTK